MKRANSRLMGRLAGGLLLAGLLEATAENNTILILDGTVSNRNAGNYYLGNTGSGNKLDILNGGGLTNVAISYVGLNAGANLNTARVDGANSLWQNTFDLYVGYSGTSNLMSISAGGRVINRHGYIGNSSGALSNLVVVSDPGSIWNCTSNLIIGYSGHGNRLVVSNQGVVVSEYSLLGSYGGLNNTALITGSGSVWSNRTLTVGGGSGLSGTNNQVVVSAGGRIESVSANGTSCIGWYSPLNELVVTGAGSVWNANGKVYVGYSSGTVGYSNRLIVADGGFVSSTNLTIGMYDGATQCWVSVAGGSLIVTNAAGVATLEAIGGDVRISNGGLVVADRLNVSNRAAKLLFDSGTLTVRKLSIANGTVTTVGNGTEAATLNLLTGTHAVTGGLFIANQATVDANLGNIGGGVTIGNGGTLLGGAHFSGAVTNQAGGLLTPGTGGDTNFFKSLTLFGGSTNEFWVGSVATHDRTQTTNGLYAADSGHPLLKLDLTAYDGSQGTIVLYDNLGANAFDSAANWFQLSDPGGPADGFDLRNNWAFYAVDGGGDTNCFVLRYDYNVATDTFGSGNDIALVAIPEPAALGGIMVVGALYWGYRRFRKVTRF